MKPVIQIEEKEIQIEFVHASGPGGQNVNKVSTAAQLRFNVINSPSLEPEAKVRLVRLAGKRMTENGILMIEARRYRSQERNRLDAIRRLNILIQKAVIKPKVRRSTHPSVTARAERVAHKKYRGQIKRVRHVNPEDWE